ncbi:MAG: hypothetical protein KAJ42_15395 [Gemmatimonadetes bacterium]|nr:hypothetical protein [Gemmatimonadota bacterium]
MGLAGLIGGSNVGQGGGQGIGALLGLLDKGRGGKRYDKDILELYKDLNLPDYVIKDLTAANIPLTGLMSEEQWEAALPGEASQVADSPAVRAQQLQSLAGLKEISEEGLPEADRLAAEEGARAMRGALRSGEETQIQGLRRRGRLGGGGEISARAVGGRLASELGRGMNVDLQREALQRRLQALSMYGSAAGAVRGQDVNTQNINAEAMNRFKQFAAMQQQQANMGNAAERQRVQQYNVQQPQQLAGQNQMLAYQNAQYNQAYQNQLRGQSYQDELQQAAGMAGAFQRLSEGAYAKQAAKQKTYENIGGGIGSLYGGAIGSQF